MYCTYIRVRDGHIHTHTHTRVFHYSVRSFKIFSKVQWGDDELWMVQGRDSTGDN